VQLTSTNSSIGLIYALKKIFDHMILKKIKVVFFFNGQRGLKILNHLKKKKTIIIKDIFFSKKNLDKSILKSIKKYKIINTLKSNLVSKALSKSDLAIIGGFPYIFSDEQINLSRLGLINCHAGILPKYRGGSPLNWQIINGERYFGISVIKINKDVDGGDIIIEKKFPLKKAYSIIDLHKIVNDKFPKLVEKSINYLLINKPLKKQKKINSYFRQRNARDSYIDLKNKCFDEIINHVRALKKPYPLPYYIYKKKKFFFYKVIKTSKDIKEKIIFYKNFFYIKIKDANLKIFLVK